MVKWSEASAGGEVRADGGDVCDITTRSRVERGGPSAGWWEHFDQLQQFGALDVRHGESWERVNVRDMNGVL